MTMSSSTAARRRRRPRALRRPGQEYADDRGAVIIDAGVGNLGNLCRAVEAVGGEGTITADPAAVAAARCLFLPGVGAFRPPRETLAGALEAAIRQALGGGAWLLGICVGYQLLFESSEEGKKSEEPIAGLGLLPGRVTRLPDTAPLPHIGWNRLTEVADHPLLAGIPEGSYVYFVHSYAPEEPDPQQPDPQLRGDEVNENEALPPEAILARCVHGRSFPAVAGRGRVFGTQFHPEKSDVLGLDLLANFLEMAYGSSAGD